MRKPGYDASKYILYGKTCIKPNFTLYIMKLTTVDKLSYLGSSLSQNGNMDDEVNSRMSKASIIYGRLHNNVWHTSGSVCA
jgi:hypothetical protein